MTKKINNKFAKLVKYYNLINYNLVYNNLSSIVNYEDTINKITYITEKKHHELLEDLAENILI